MRSLIALAAALCLSRAAAEDFGAGYLAGYRAGYRAASAEEGLTFLDRIERPWVFEAEIAYIPQELAARVAQRTCLKVIPPQYVRWYAVDPRPEWEWSCGGNPVYTHFLGRLCWRPLKHLGVECGWRHRSSPFTSVEISWDAFAVRMRFEF